MPIFNRRDPNNPDDARNYSIGDAKRDKVQLDDVHVRSYDPDKDVVLDQQFIGNSEGGKAEAERIKDAIDAEAKQRGKNISASVKPKRGGYTVVVFTPKPKKK